MSLDLLIAVVSFMGGMLMSLEYFLETDKLAQLDSFLRSEFTRVKSFRLPKLSRLLLLFTWTMTWSEHDYGEENTRRIFERTKDVPTLSIVIAIVLFFGCLFLGYVLQNRLIGIFSLFSPFFAFLMLWFFHTMLRKTIALLERGPRGVLGTIGFIFFVIGSLLAIYLAAADKS